MDHKAKKLVYLSLLTATAVVLGYAEALFPLPTPVPYIKLGLGNVIIVSTLYTFGVRNAFMVSMVKVLLSSVLFLGFSGFIYSFTGAAVSLLAMCLLKRTRLFSVLGVSVAGSVCHMLGQIGVATVFIENVNLSFFLAPLLLAGAGTGVLVGLISAYLIRHLPLIMAEINNIP